MELSFGVVELLARMQFEKKKGQGACGKATSVPNRGRRGRIG
jgi:hypothetical protein